MVARFATFREFYPFYTCRKLHFAGTSLAATEKVNEAVALAEIEPLTGIHRQALEEITGAR